MAEFVWSKSRRVYLNKTTGRPVTAAQLLKWVNSATDNASERTRRLAEKLNNGEITDREFQVQMHTEITKGHSAFAAAALGGLAVMTALRWQQVGTFIRRQFGYMMRFARDIVGHQVTPAELENRAAMYAEAFYSTYSNTTVLRERSGGRQYARRVLDPAAEHCTDCPDLAGIYPIDQVPPIGASQCGPRCRCTIEFIDGTAEQAA